MKRLKYAVILLLGLSMVIMSSCTKDPSNGGGNNGNTYNGHEYVDLGLPSGTLWATCNVGATSPDGLGGGFAWAGLESYDTIYGPYWDESLQRYTKYNDEDGLLYLMKEDDIAAQSWGDGWRIPTIEEWEELYGSCDYKFNVQNGQWGLLLTRGEKSLFLPGDYDIYDGHPVGGAYYWTNQRFSGFEHWAYCYYFFLYYKGSMRFEQKVDHHNRYSAFRVRPVYSPNSDEPEPTEGFTIIPPNGLK